MKLHDYYENTADREEAWKDQAFDHGFAPCKHKSMSGDHISRPVGGFPTREGIN